MGKLLGNIPRQPLMTTVQEQTFTNGINKGRKLSRKELHARALSIMENANDTDKETLTAFIDKLFN